MSGTNRNPNRTLKQERRAAKRDAIQWNMMNKWSRRNGNALLFRVPEPGTSVAQWARLRRDEPVRLSVKIQVPVTINRTRE